jgi:hypothetical protein
MIHALPRFDYDAAPITTVSAIGTTLGDKPLATKTATTVATLSRDDFDLDAINKHAWLNEMVDKTEFIQLMRVARESQGPLGSLSHGAGA